MINILPATRGELKVRGWDAPDVILVTGDAYVDHPSYGVAVIGRVLEAAGFRVGIIAQPDWKSIDDFMRLGRPRLFFGITSGNLDSMVANYTANKRPRKEDAYSAGGRTGLRPDRAVIVYTNRIREAFGDIPIVLGGIEASLRRVAHFDWWSNKVRRSILLDAKADILVYGMGEEQVVEIARRIKRGEDLYGIRGTVIVRKEPASSEDCVALPSYNEVAESTKKFNEAFRSWSVNQDPFYGKTLLQGHDARVVIHFPPPLPLTENELDRIYGLPFTRTYHPVYKKHGGVPGFETVKFSIISHRGCCGACSFCSLSAHQGKIIQSRSKESILGEAKIISKMEGFKGTITDVGGPTANLYGAKCSRWTKEGHCSTKECLLPEKCAKLKPGYRESIDLLATIRALPGVKHVFIESGIRYDLLVQEDSLDYLEYICRHHISGQMKVAPEHAADSVLRAMNKPRFAVYERFVELFKSLQKRIDKDQYLVNYFIISHPGATLADEQALSSYLKRRGMRPEQVQDYTPLPLTASACMFYTEEHPFTGEKLYVAKTFKERKMRRASVQYRNRNTFHR